jgi:hypothetical protein
MTLSLTDLADAIDPRLQPPETVTGGMSWVLQTKDLIAASNFIRSHSASPSAEEVRTLSTRLSGVSVSDSTKALMELCREAGDMLTRLSTQEAVDAAYERAAGIVEGCPYKGALYNGRYRTWPEWGTGTRTNESDEVSLTKALAAAIRARKSNNAKA